MPYPAGDRLPGERASKLGHLDVLKSEHVRELCHAFESHDSGPGIPVVQWTDLPAATDPLALVFGIDGSVQVITNEAPPHKALGFVKTALLRVDSAALKDIDREAPNPFQLRDILADSALYHATVFPLRHVSVPGLSVYHAVRRIIFDSVGDASLGREPMETLKWLAYEKWDGQAKQLPLFECPHCEDTVATLPFDAEVGKCGQCSGDLFLTDMLGFHQEMGPDAAPNTVTTSYMAIHETLLLFTGIRFFWEKNRDTLKRCLFVKDGPLSIRAQYSKLVAPIRRFFTHAQAKGVAVCVIGQEKTGAFADHLTLIGASASAPTYFLPGDHYIKANVQHRPVTGAPYGRDTNYGAKVFVKLTEHHQMVLNVPTAGFIPSPSVTDLIGFDRIVATLPAILSNRHQGALLPVELANGVASLSTYPSARILKIFAEAASSGA